nr:ribonuclease H-like domain-containing protein [Tanacetum cinerariifolium]
KSGTIRTVLSLASSRLFSIHQLNVKNAFLHGDLSKTVYMHQLPGFQDSAHPDYVCLLQRSPYGLKQAPRAWFQEFVMMSFGKHWKEKHVIWAQLGKKQDKNATLKFFDHAMVYSARRRRQDFL